MVKYVNNIFKYIYKEYKHFYEKFLKIHTHKSIALRMMLSVEHTSI